MTQVDDVAVATALHGHAVDVAVRRRVNRQALALLGANVQSTVEVVRPQIAQDARQRIGLSGRNGEEEIVFGVRCFLGERGKSN